MRALFGLLCIIAFATDASPALAETWLIRNGQPVEGQLSGVYGSIAIITGNGHAKLLSLDQIDDTGLARIADYLGASTKESSTWASSTGKIARSLRHRLQIMQEGKMVAFDPGTRPEPVIYLAYFGAHWCPPCRAFSPKLVAAYRRLKTLAPGRFELIFVSDDHSHDEQVSYAREIGMPWPILKFSQVGTVDPIERWAGPAIPDLVVLPRSGELGRVTDAKIEPQLPAVLEYQLEQDAESWLFLPAVANGRPKPTRVKLPINF